MADIVSLWGLTGATASEIYKYIRKIRHNPGDDYKLFAKGIRKTVTDACRAYREYAGKSSEGLRHGFLDRKNEERIFDHILLSLQENKPLVIEDLLPEERDLPDHERRLLFHFLSVHVNCSLEFCLRDFAAWVRQEISELSGMLNGVEASVKRLEESFSVLKDKINDMPLSWRAIPITYEWVRRCSREARENPVIYRQRYYEVTDNESVYQHAICAGMDCPNREAIDAADEILKKSDRHLMIVGDGGEGKTSLLFRLAVEQATRENNLCFWLHLRDIEITSADRDSAGRLLDSISSQAEICGKTAYLFIDNPYQGGKMLDTLGDAWTPEHRVRLVTAERTMNMRDLCSPNNNRMSPWSGNSEFLCLYPYMAADKSDWMQIYRNIPVSVEWKTRVMESMMEARRNVDEEILDSLKRKKLRDITDKPVSLVEFMYDVIIEYNKIVKETGRMQKVIRLDWDIWEEEIRKEPLGVTGDSFECIAAFYRIGLPVSAEEFSRYYGIRQHLFEDFVKRHFGNNINPPVQLTYIDGKAYIAPKHDMIPDLYFNFNPGKRFEDIMQKWLDAMDENVYKAAVGIRFAEWHSRSYNLDEAERQYKDSIVLCEKVYGLEHPSTATIYSNMAGVYYRRGEYGRALEWNEKALKIMEAVLGSEHPVTATTYNNIAGVYDSKGEYDRALEWYEKALKIKEAALGKEHPSTAITYNNIALVLRSKGEYGRALGWYVKALKIKEAALGKEHPSTATTYNNIALVLRSKGEYDRALEWYEKALRIKEAALGKGHPSTATTYNNIALVYKSKGKPDRALEWYEKALRIREKVLGMEHPSTANTYNNIAGVYYRKGEYDRALEWYKKALKIREAALGKEHPVTSTTYNNIAVIYKSKGDYDRALEWYEKALRIKEAALGKEHPSTATVYNNMAGVYKSKDEPDRALELYEKALRIREKVLGMEHPSTAATYKNIAGVYDGKGEYDKALKRYSDVLYIFLKKAGECHPNTKIALNNVYSAYIKAGKNEADFISWLNEKFGEKDSS